MPTNKFPSRTGLIEPHYEVDAILASVKSAQAAFRPTPPRSAPLSLTYCQALPSYLQAMNMCLPRKEEEDERNGSPDNLVSYLFKRREVPMSEISLEGVLLR